MQNAIFGIHNEEGVWLDQPEMVTQAFLDYYQ